jgi:hypothetical protein
MVQNLRGSQQGRSNILNWLFDCLRQWSSFDIERSSNGVDFSSIGKTKGWDPCKNLFEFKHNAPAPGNNYYRVKVTENGKAYYSNTILLQTENTSGNSLYPNLLKKGQLVQVVFAESKGSLHVRDAMGREVYSQSLTNGVQNVSLPVSASGVYYYSIQNAKSTLASGKLIVQ